MIVLIVLILLFGSNNSNFKKELDGYLKNKLNSYEKWSYQIIKAPDENMGQIKIIDQNKLSVNGNLAYIPIEIVSANGRSVRSYVTIRLELFKKVFVAAKQIEAKEPLSSSDVKIKTVNISELRGTPVDLNENISKFRSRVNINSGEIIRTEMIEEQPVITAGQTITAKAVFGSVVVSTKAVARQNGLEGEIIKILTDNNKQLNARVIDSNNVIVEE